MFSNLRSHVIEDKTAHQSKLENLIENDRNTSEVSANESIVTIQLLPRSHPEEEVEKLGQEHSKHVVGSKGFNLSSLLIRWSIKVHIMIGDDDKW